MSYGANLSDKNGQSAAKLRRITMYNLQSFEEKVNSLTEDNIIILSFNGVKKPVRFICEKCGQEQEVKRGESLLRKNKKYQCKFCHNSKEHIRKENLIKVQYLCDKKKYIELLSFPKQGRNCIFQCNRCGKKFNREYNRFLKNPTCPSCDTYSQTNLNAWWDKFIQNHNEEDYEVLEPEKWEGTHKDILIRHKCGFIWKAKPCNLYINHCPKCNRKISNGEKFITKWLEENDIIFEWQYKVEPWNKKWLFLDFYLPKQKIALEYQGMQHFKPVQGWDPERFEERQKNDEIKRLYCKKNNITLYEIPYGDNTSIKEYLEGSTTIRKE